MAGYTLILAILILGGIIATLGDRIGTKVGKARLSIFNLRPRKTATLVTILTGGLISASTLGILIATSSQLRDGLFKLDSIRSDLKNTQAEKQKVEEDLNIARSQTDRAQNRLSQINRSLQEALARQSRTQAKLQLAQRKFQRATEELEKVLIKEKELDKRIQSLTAEQETLLAQSNKLKQERDQLASDREKLQLTVIDSQTRLDKIEKQRKDLQSEVASLESSREQLIKGIDILRRGNFAIRSEQVLAAGVISPNRSDEELRRAVLQLLQEADQAARNFLDFPKESKPVIEVTDTQVDSLIKKLQGGGSYVIRVLSAGNYLRKESRVAILADITPNKQVFASDEVIATLQFTPNMLDKELEEQLDRLFLLVSFRARQEGVLPNPFTGKVGTFPQNTVFELIQDVKRLGFPYEIRAVSKGPIFTGGPLNLQLVVYQNGVEIRRFG